MVMLLTLDTKISANGMYSLKMNGLLVADR